MKIKALLVDDEPWPRKLLRSKLETMFREVEIIGEADSADSAFEAIETLHPDLLFLDISMPGESGFDLLRRLPHLNFEIIFITSYDQYAIEAIDFCAIGYILKPIMDNQLEAAIARATERIEQKIGYHQNAALIENLTQDGVNKQIALMGNHGIEFVKTKDIVRCEGFQKYTKIHLRQGRMIVSSHNIGKYVGLLSAYQFYSIHKSHLINTHFIQKYNSDGNVILSTGDKVPVSRRKKQDFVKYLKTAM